MFSLPTTFQSQRTVPLTHLINVVQYLKSSANTAITTSVQSLQRDLSPEHDPDLSEPKVNLKDLGLSELRYCHVRDVLEHLLPSIDPEEKSISSAAQNSTTWRTSHISASSFFQNKYGELHAVTLLPLMEGFKTMKSKTRHVQSGFEGPNVTFEHVKGVEEAKNELQDVVEFLRTPQKFTVLGGKLPKGILLVGPPGTGKTLLARAVAGEADVPFYYASGSEFDEMFVGVGASRIRNLFKEAKASAPCVIFIDELDSVGGKRIESPMHPYSRQTINQLLAEMDGFKPNEGVIVIGATNFAEALDNALVRPGRFDMQVTVPRPDVKGRTEILEWYLKKIKVDSAVDAEIIARGTVGFSGAGLENLVNQAALKAAGDGKDLVTMKEMEFAKDKILMGPERRSVQIDKRNKMITAYHESGHAIVAYYTKDAMPINKATIMPRGPSLGHVSLLPENDRWNETRAQLLAQMDVSMGGRVAEELVFGNDHITTGASSDFDGATKIAQMMVTQFGMSDKLGVMTYNDLTNHSSETQAAVEQEVRVLLQNSYERAKNLLKTYSKEHKLLADALLTYETLNAKEIQMILEGKSLDPR
uniref:ATP-dependent zinc metalloprotease YME1L1 n=1 Tax=Sinocyclocheilus anshuiensis TaxID=1608454 RepID=A0A671NL18_9TELE